MGAKVRELRLVTDGNYAESPIQTLDSEPESVVTLGIDELRSWSEAKGRSRYPPDLPDDAA
jgi:hypothetical protein